MTTAEDPNWVEVKNSDLRLLETVCPERLRLEGDKPHAPLWLAVLAQAWRGAVYVPAGLDFADLIRMIESDSDKRLAVACMSRLGVVSASDVLAAVLE